MMPFDRCSKCPGNGCLAQRLGHKRFCEWLDLGEDFARAAAGLPTASLDASPAASTTKPPGGGVERWNAFVELRDGCDYRGEPVECGCGSLRVCRAGKSRRPDGGVSDRECWECLGFDDPR